MSASPDLAPQELRLLVAVAGEGSFTAAADLLGITQSAVSHGIRAVERKVGAVLFERGRFGARPTPAGRQAVARARQVLRQLELLVVEAGNAQRGSVSGTIRIAAFRSAAVALLPPALKALAQRFPAVKPKVLIVAETGAGTVGEVQAGRADLAIATLDEGAAPPAGLVAGELLCEPYVLAYPAAHRGPQGLALIDWPENCSSYTRGWWAVQDFLPEATLEVADDSVALTMISQGLGMAVLPRLALSGAMPGVATEELGDRPPTRRIVYVTSRADANAVVTRELIRRLRSATRVRLDG
jgi:DNA-binding transcriptional LysR family regulator